jgi:selenocysteine lyase/cysteine desulfurase
MKSAIIALLPTECLSKVDYSLNLPEKGQSPSSVEFLLHKEEFYQHLYVEQHSSAGVTSPKLTASYYHAREDIAMLTRI